MSSKQITVRGVSEQLAGRLKALAKARGESLNATALRLLKQAVGQEDRKTRLRRYATWNEEDYREFERFQQEHRQVDPELWND